MQLSFYAETDYRLWVLLAQARDALQKARTAELASNGVSAVEAYALFALHDLGPSASPAEVSRMMFRGHNTVSALLVRMEKKGLLERARDRSRRNIWRVNLTEQGKLACERAMEIKSLRAAFSDLSELDKEQLEKHLRSVRDRALAQLVSEPVRMVP